MKRDLIWQAGEYDHKNIVVGDTQFRREVIYIRCHDTSRVSKYFAEVS
jgi:hypothetical protein